MNDMEGIEVQTYVANARVADLLQQLESTQRSLRELRERLMLSPEERAVLEGHADGCVRINELRPILRRILGEAA